MPICWVPEKIHALLDVDFFARKSMDILIYGIVNSIKLALIALGFTLVYGISRLPNFAHGAIYVVTGFLVWSGIHTLGLPYVVSIFLALSITGLIGAVILLLLWAFTCFTKIGLALRALAQDEQAAMMLGIDSDRMAIVAMTLGSVLAALAAVVLLPLGNIIVEAVYNVLILAIAVCIVGGLGSWIGAVLASFLIGFAQIITDVYIESHFQMMVALLAIIITLILRPSGLFGRQKELEERV